MSTSAKLIKFKFLSFLKLETQRGKKESSQSSSMELLGVEMIMGAVVILMLTWGAISALELFWWKPKRLERALRAQGLKGRPYRFPFGDLKDNSRFIKEAQAKPMTLSHTIFPRVAPFLFQSISQFGKFSFIWFGPGPRVAITDPELIREVLSNKFGHFQKPKNAAFRFLVSGLLGYDGEKWAKHRRIIAPAFHVEKLKRMLPAFSICCNELIGRWENLIGSSRSCELDVWPEFQNFSGDVISQSAFGSNYKEGRRIFQLQAEQAEQAELLIQSFQFLFIPGYRFLPTSRNLRMKKIVKEVRALLRGIIVKREQAIKVGAANTDDLLGLLLESNMNEGHGKSSNSKMTIDEVIEECKLFYFAGQETTSVLLTWTMILLGMHPNWQARAREEVLQVFGKNKPDIDGLSRLKTVTMILNEVLRLYPPVITLVRQTYKSMKLGGITYPEGVTLSLPIMHIHHDTGLWGEDAHDFNPERFAGGVSKASKDQVAFFPFGGGPRVCIGQSFAVLEAKMGLSMILQHFEFELSPSYLHAPYTVITLHPQHGAQIILRKL